MNRSTRHAMATAVSCVGLLTLAACGNGGGSAGGGNAAVNTPAPAPVANAAPIAPAPVMPAAQPASGPTRYCGTIHNSTVNQDSQAEIDVGGGGGFSGSIVLNGSSLSGGAGAFQGTMANGQCSGTATDGSGLTFTGACPSGGSYTGTYSIQGQQGTFQMSSSACH